MMRMLTLNVIACQDIFAAAEILYDLEATAGNEGGKEACDRLWSPIINHNARLMQKRWYRGWYVCRKYYYIKKLN